VRSLKNTVFHESEMTDAPATIDLTVTEPATDLRIDAWLALQLPDFSRSRLQKLLLQGQVQLNDQPCENKKQKLQVGDRLIVQIPPATDLDLIPEPIKLDILYEDDQLLIVNKPVGMVVHPAPGHSSGTLVHALLAHCPLSSIGGVHRPGIVHRLDRDTTGAIMVAKTDFVHQHLQAQLQAKTARREYLGVVYGSPKIEGGTIDLPIGRHPVERQKQAVLDIEDGGREAVTHWQVLERLGNYSLLQFRLETGRTHQIRVHTTHLGHAIVGDALYGSGRAVKVNMPGHALHAWQLQLVHPVTGELVVVQATPPPFFEKLLNVLRMQSRK
jgi:23S rRNA pseudouridine1911/1915/1917 synthase